MAVPTVTGLDPASGPEGTSVLITGTGFTEDTSRVRFGTYECQLNYTIISDTAISAIIPAGSGTQTCYVTNPDGTNATGPSFTFATYEGGSNAVPTVTGLSDHTAPGYDGEGGESVVITGTGFATAIAVYFGPTLATAVQASFTRDSPTQITCTSPRGEPGTTAYVFVENNYGVSADADSDNAYAYQSSAIPTVTSLTPATALFGFEVTIAGTGFTTATAVRVGTLYAQFTIVGDTSITFTVPGDISFLGTTAEVYVSNWWGESTTHATFTYATSGTLKTTLTLDTGTPAQSPSAGWIVTTGSLTATLTATYTPWSAETYVESKWYRLDGGANTRYTGTFAISGQGSHKVEFWSVGKDGVVEATNVRYVNIVASTSVTVAGTAGIGVINLLWNTVAIPGVLYEVYIDTTATPTTLYATMSGSSIAYKLSAGATGIYCRVRAISPDGTAYSYSNIVGPLTALQSQTTDLADDAITAAKMAPGLNPPKIVDVLPTLPDPEFPPGTTVFLTTDGKLYKYEGGGPNMNTGTTSRTWTDLSGYGRHGTLNSAFTLTQANKVYNPRLVEDGTNNYPLACGTAWRTSLTGTLTQDIVADPETGDYYWEWAYTAVTGDTGYLAGTMQVAANDAVGDFLSQHCEVQYAGAGRGLLQTYVCTDNWVDLTAEAQLRPDVPAPWDHAVSYWHTMDATGVAAQADDRYYVFVAHVRAGVQTGETIRLRIRHPQVTRTRTQVPFFHGGMGDGFSWGGTVNQSVSIATARRYVTNGWHGDGTEETPYSLMQDQRTPSDSALVQVASPVVTAATVEIRLKKAGTSSSSNTYIWYNSPNNYAMLYANPTGTTPIWYVRLGSTDKYLFSENETNSIGEWHTYTLTAGPSGADSYIDGATVSGGHADDGAWAGLSTTTYLFNTYGSTSMSEIAVFRLYERILTSTEIAQNAAVGAATSGYVTDGLLIDYNAAMAIGAGAWEPVVNTTDLDGDILPNQMADPPVAGAIADFNASRAKQGLMSGNNTDPTSVWTDISGQGHDLTLGGTFAYTPTSGWDGDGTRSDPYRLVFDGSNDYAATADMPGGTITAITLDVWYQGGTQTTGSNRYAIAKTSDYAIRTYTSTANTFGMYLGGVFSVDLLRNVNDGTMHHLVAVWDGAARTVRMYDNGVDVGGWDSSNNVPASFACGTEQLFLGAWADWYGPVLAGIPSARVYPFALTPAQVLQNYNAGYGRPDVNAITVDAGDLADHSIAQSKLALSIRPPFLSATAPTLPSAEFPEGSTYYNTTDNHLYKTVNGTTWGLLVDSGDIVANTITAGQIATGAITADELAANSVFAKQLVLADFENLIQNSNSEWDPTGHDVTEQSVEYDFRGVTDQYPYLGSRCRRVGAGDGYDNYYQIIPWIPCTEGEEFVFEAMVRCGQAETSGPMLYLQYLNAAGQQTSAAGTASPGGVTYTKLSTTAVAAAGTVWVVAYLWNNIQIPGHYTYYDNLFLRRKNAGNMIVDGSITAAKIYSGAVQADKIQAGNIAAGAISTDHLAAGSVTTSKLLVGGGGGTLNPDPLLQDASEWTIQDMTFETVTTAPVGTRIARSGTNAGGQLTARTGVSVSPDKSYVLRFWHRHSVSGGLLYAALIQYDGAGNYLAEAPYSPNGVLGSATWTEYAGVFAAGTLNSATRKVYLKLWFNWAAPNGYHEVCNPRLSEKVLGTLIADGAITTDHMTANTIDADRLLANSIEAGKIEAAAIGAREMAAGSIFSNTIVVAGENLVPNGFSEATTTGLPTWAYEIAGITSADFYAGTKSRRCEGNTSVTITPPIECKEGDEFHLNYWSKLSTADNQGRICCVIHRSTGGDTFNGPTFTTGTTWAETSWDLVIPANAISFQAYLEKGGSAGTYFYADNIILRKKMEGNLIVEGTTITDVLLAEAEIVAPHIHSVADPYTFELTTGGTIRGARLENLAGTAYIATDGTIHGMAIDSTTSITGATITGATLRTADASTYPRVEVSPSSGDDIRFYPASGTTAGYLDTDEGYNWNPGGMHGLTYTAYTRLASPDYDSNGVAYVGLRSCSIGPVVELNGRTEVYGDIYCVGELFQTTRTKARLNHIFAEHDFTSHAQSWSGTAIPYSVIGGTWMVSEWGDTTPTVSSAYDIDHPGVMAFTTGTATNTGHRAATNANSFDLFTGDSSEFIFRTPYVTGSNQFIRMGFMDSYSNTAPTAGAWAECYHDGTAYRLKLRVYGSGAVRTSAEYYTLSSTTNWYRVVIYFDASGYANMDLYLNGSATPLLGTGTGYSLNANSPGFDVATYLPATPCGHGFVNYSASATPQNNLDLDYMNFFMVPRQSR